MPSKTGYTVYDDRFVRISKDEKGNETIIAEDVDQAEAARRLISLWLAGNIESTDTQQKMSDQDFAEQVLRTALIQIVGQKITLDQQTEILRHVYGNNPRIVALFARYVDKDWATQLWGI